jgi:hypothetical protein
VSIHNHRLICVTALVAIAWAFPAAAEDVCAPDKMLKVVTVADTPHLDPASFAAKPRTLYRQGERYGRVEEPLNPRTGTQLVFVVNEPDVWVADLVSKRGEHALDPGPSYVFRAQIFGEAASNNTVIRGIEFGCEARAMRAAGAKETMVDHETFGRVTQLEHTEASEKIVVLLDGKSKPKRLELYYEDKLAFAMNYAEYNDTLPFNPTLFQKPAGIEYQDAHGSGNR